MVLDDKGVRPRGRIGRAGVVEERYGCELLGCARLPEYLEGGDPGAECMVVEDEERELALELAAGEVSFDDMSEDSLSVGEAASQTISSSLSYASGERDPRSDS